MECDGSAPSPQVKESVIEEPREGTEGVMVKGDEREGIKTEVCFGGRGERKGRGGANIVGMGGR